MRYGAGQRDRLQDWMYFYSEITEAYLREHGFAEWLDEYLDEDEDEISDDDRYQFVQLIEDHIFQHGKSYTYGSPSDAKEGNDLLIKCIMIALERCVDDDFTVDEFKALVATMGEISKKQKEQGQKAMATVS